MSRNRKIFFFIALSIFLVGVFLNIQIEMSDDKKPKRADKKIAQQKNVSAPKPTPEPEPLPEPTPEPVVTPAPRPEKTLPKIKSKLYRPKQACDILAAPQEESKIVGQLKKGRKVWVDGHDSKWGKVYLKSGEGFIPGDCL